MAIKEYNKLTSRFKVLKKQIEELSIPVYEKNQIGAKLLRVEIELLKVIREFLPTAIN